MMDIKIFWSVGGQVGGPGVGWFFFLHITILFHQCNDKKNISAVLLLFTLYILLYT